MKILPSQLQHICTVHIHKQTVCFVICPMDSRHI